MGEKHRFSIHKKGRDVMGRGRRLLAAALALGLTLLLGMAAAALEEDPSEGQALPDSYGQQLEASGAEALYRALPEDTQDALAQAGLDQMDLYGILNTSPQDIITILLHMLQGGSGAALRSGALAAGLMIMISAAGSLLPDDEKLLRAVEVTGSMLALMVMLPGLTELMKAAGAAVRAGCDFSLLLIPILAGIITATGNPTLALSYHSMAFAAAQGLSQLADGVIVPCTGIVLGLSLVDTATPDTKLSSLAELIKKAVIGTFAVLAGLFSALLSIKSLIANTADAMTVRGVKVLVGSVPVVGSALSEACGAILSSISLVKGAVGGFALLAAALLYAPVLLQLLLWSFLLKLLAAASGLMKLDTTQSMFQSVGYAVSILGACVIFNAALLILSTGLVLSIKSN
ncbi:MAG: stage III sporulation protein AE [Oscillospiraceae bacterium]|jgi:hypothetical protein|nr:stage III sporulation protein AE [Oscillospiraceae bacterium]